MRRDQRELLDLVLAGMRATDGVYVRLAQDVDRLVRRYPADRPLSRDDARILRRQVDEATRRAFGRTRRTAADSTLYRAIVDARTAAAMLPYRRAIARVQAIVEQRDPDLWRRITAEPSPRTRFTDALLGMVGMVLAAMLLPWLPLQISLTPRQASVLDPTDPDDWLELVQLMRREGDATRLFQTGLFDPERAWVDGSTYRLSDRVWLTGQDVRRDIDRTIQHALRTGTGPVTLADDLQQYLNPWYQPLRVTSGGSIIVDMTRQRTLGAKHATNAARRLARTELMAVHGQATIGSAAATPGVIGVKWMLSNAHPESDPCDDKANGSSRGMPRGVYRPDEVPHYPTHPNEMCVLAHHHMSREELLDQLAEQYGAAPSVQDIPRRSAADVEDSLRKQSLAAEHWYEGDDKYLMQYQLDSSPLNGLLRSGSFRELPPDVQALDNMMNWEVPPGTTLYRGVGTRRLGDIQPGSVITDPAYMSTSLDDLISADFATMTAQFRGGNAPAMLEIRTTAHQPGLYLDATRVGRQNDFGQMEFVLPRNTSLVVESIEERDGMMWVIAGIAP